MGIIQNNQDVGVVENLISYSSLDIMNNFDLNLMSGIRAEQENEMTNEGFSTGQIISR